MKMVNFDQEEEGYKNTLNVSNYIFFRNIITKWKINGTVEVKAMSGEKCLEETKPSKELQKGVAKTGLAVHRTKMQYTLTNKDLHLKKEENIEKPEAF